MYVLVFTKQAQKDAFKIKQAGLKAETQKLLDVIAEDPWQNPPSYEKLVGDLLGCCSRRINIQHRLVYEVFEKEKKVKVLRLWSHYDH